MTPTTPAAYLAMNPYAVNEQCGDGDGVAIGLAAVPAEHVEQTAERAAAWFTSHDTLECDHVACRLARGARPGAYGSEYGDHCAECDVTECNMSADEIADHVIAGGFVLVGCEGFHTAAFRAVYALGDQINDAIATAGVR